MRVWPIIIKMRQSKEESLVANKSLSNHIEIARALTKSYVAAEVSIFHESQSLFSWYDQEMRKSTDPLSAWRGMSHTVSVFYQKSIDFLPDVQARNVAGKYNEMKENAEIDICLSSRGNNIYMSSVACAVACGGRMWNRPERNQS